MTNGFSVRLRRLWKRRVWMSVRRQFRPQVDVPVANGIMRVDLRDAVIGPTLYLDGEYEAELRRLFEAADLSGGVCVDVGANIGLHTISMSRLAGDRGKVYAFEPESRNFKILEHNLRRNGIRNVSAVQNAVGDREGSCRLAVHPSNYGDHRIAASGPVPESNLSHWQDLPMTTLDTALATVPAGSVKLIKIDVQGFEFHVVRGMRQTLRRNPDAILILEVFPEGLTAAGSSAAELVSAVRDLGFDGWELHDSRLVPMLEPWAYDLIRGGKYEDLALSRAGVRIGEVLGRLHGQPLDPARAGHRAPSTRSA